MVSQVEKDVCIEMNRKYINTDRYEFKKKIYLYSRNDFDLNFIHDQSRSRKSKKNVKLDTKNISYTYIKIRIKK